MQQNRFYGIWLLPFYTYLMITSRKKQQAERQKERKRRRKRKGRKGERGRGREKDPSQDSC